MTSIETDTGTEASEGRVARRRAKVRERVLEAAEQLMAVELRGGESRGPRSTLARWFSAAKPAAVPSPVPLTEV